MTLLLEDYVSIRGDLCVEFVSAVVAVLRKLLLLLFKPKPVFVEEPPEAIVETNALLADILGLDYKAFL